MAAVLAADSRTKAICRPSGDQVGLESGAGSSVMRSGFVPGPTALT